MSTATIPNHQSPIGNRPRRGRGATPRIEREYIAPRPNPSGRRKLTYKFRPLKHHSNPYQSPVDAPSLPDPPKLVYELACNLIAKYFELVGGFRLTNDAVVAAWSDALDLYTPREITWAIEAKAASLAGATAEEAREKRVYVSRPEAFDFNQWLEKSPAYQARVKRRRDDAYSARVREQESAVQKQEHDAFVAGRLSREKMRAQRNARHARQKAERDRRKAEYWNSLSQAQRRAACHAVGHAFEQDCKIMMLDPQAPAADRVLLALAADWALERYGPAQDRPSTDHQLKE